MEKLIIKPLSPMITPAALLSTTHCNANVSMKYGPTINRAASTEKTLWIPGSIFHAWFVWQMNDFGFSFIAAILNYNFPGSLALLDFARKIAAVFSRQQG